MNFAKSAAETISRPDRISTARLTPLSRASEIRFTNLLELEPSYLGAHGVQASSLVSQKTLGLLLGCALIDFYGACSLRIRAHLLGHSVGDGVVLGSPTAAFRSPGTLLRTLRPESCSLKQLTG